MTAWPRFKFYGTPDIFMAAARDVLAGRVHDGDDVARLENEVCRMTGRRHAVAVPQARVGLYLVIREILARTQRRKVILSPYTIYDVVNMVVCAGGTPVFADVDPRSGNLDPITLPPLLDDDTAAVIVTHLHGMLADLSAISALCDTHGSVLIEDVAQAFGGRWHGRMAGAVGQVGIFSFGRAKNVNCFFGGMVITDDDTLATTIRTAIRQWPEVATAVLAKRVIHCAIIAMAVSRLVFPWLTRHLFRRLALVGERTGAALFSTERNPIVRHTLPVAWHCRLTPMQARIALTQLSGISTQQEQRLALARIYADGLRGIPEITHPESLPGAEDIFLGYAIQVPDRLACQEHLLWSGLDVVIQHIGNCADYDVFAPFQRHCPQTRHVADSVLILPTYPGYPHAQAKNIVCALRSYFAQQPENQ
ncbi:DegT/DnrJ/EryC1/StrS family aminotransferase [Magnetospirillum sulfuroxidans]|uniref:DegT/DnrJ/EryC1/StrS aminotransferase family protein n=1 Tax=Magnetospirillum sulfuroxidans TaxID=611300 RepID=A0ABS5IEC1_9PROT|nr:DegT/DnrJ/EryC1/StrS aminotransferase family protein [Magnetospirillum sulfuroxidans]MBR9972776.1 DegT/DnrJ/EryC1/StrS aminotransferase family protein [Magnetospirillum sulfuroxidans]